jgi:hypothetical protein
MNAHVQIALEEIAQRAQAVVKCEVCHNYYVSADDEEANSLAYAMATNAYKRGEFRTTTLEETRDAMKAVLRDASHRCPSCG